MEATLGIRFDLLIAATFGAAFLVLYRHPTPRQSIGAVIGGLGGAVYFTPLTVRVLRAYFEWFPADALGERAVAVLWGLLGAFFFAGLITFGERFRKDPVKTIRGAAAGQDADAEENHQGSP